MNRGVRLMLIYAVFIALYGPAISLAQLIPVDDVGPYFCNAVILAEDEFAHSKSIFSEFSAATNMLATLKETADGLNANTVLTTDIQSLISQTTTLKMYQSTWEEALRYITDITKFVNDEKLSHCRRIFDEGITWRELNYAMEINLQNTLLAYTHISDCLLSGEMNSCTYDVEIWLSGIHEELNAAAVSEQIREFREIFADLRQTFVVETQPSFCLVNLISFWIDTLKEMEVEFSESIETDINDTYKPMLMELVIVQGQLQDIIDEIQQIQRHIMAVNSDDDVDVRGLISFVTSINNRMVQLHEINSFLNVSVSKLRTLARNIRHSTSDVTYWSDTRVEGDQNKEYALRIKIGEHIVKAHELMGSVSSAKTMLPAAIERLQKYNMQSVESAKFRAFRVYGSLMNYDDKALTFLNCVQVNLDICRSISIVIARKARLDEKYTAPVIDKYIERNTNFLVKIQELINHQTWDIHILDRYLDDIDNGSSTENPFYTGEHPRTADVTAYRDFLTRFTQYMGEIFDVACDMDQNLLYATLLVGLGPETTFVLDDDFVQNNLDSGHTIDEYLDSTIEILTPQMLDIDTKYTDLINIYNNANNTFHGKMSSSMGRMEGLQSMKTSLLEKETQLTTFASNLEPHFQIPSYAGPLAVKRFFNQYPTSPSVDYSQYSDPSMWVTAKDLFEPVVLEEDENGILGGKIRKSTSTKRVTDEDIAVHFTNHETVSLFTTDNGGQLFTWPVCDLYCLYSFDMKNLEETHVAVGFGYKDPSSSNQLLKGVFFNSKVGITTTALELGSYLNVRSHDTKFWVGGDTIKNDITEMFVTHEAEHYQPVIAIAGDATFEWTKIHADLVTLASPIVESESYDVFEMTVHDTTSKLAYVMKKDLINTHAMKWYSVTQKSASECVSIGAAAVLQRKPFDHLLFGVFYDGNHVVHNPYYSCVINDVGLEPGTHVKESDTDDDDDDDDTDDNDTDLRELYMAYEIDLHGDLSANLTLFFYSDDEDYYKLVIPSAKILLPSLINRSLEFVSDNSHQLTPSEFNPDAEPQVLCKTDEDCRLEITGEPSSECSFSLVCRNSASDCEKDEDCDEDDKCIESKSWKFGTCNRSDSPRKVMWLIILGSSISLILVVLAVTATVCCLKRKSAKKKLETLYESGNELSSSSGKLLSGKLNLAQEDTFMA